MRRKKGHGNAEDGSEIDLTPMLDVVFIMLIFFIVTASFVKENTIDVNVPEKQENTPPDEKNHTILVEVRSNNDIWMEQRRVDVQAIRANIERIHAEHPEATVVVKADAKSSAKAFVAVADAAREAGIYSVSLARPEPTK